VRDRRLLYAAAFVRALATGMAGVLLGLYLTGLAFSPAAIGVIVGAGLAGGAAAALVAILVAPSGAAPVLPFLFLAGFMAGGAHGFLYPALSALLMDVTPERRRGSAVGTFSSVVLVGNAMGAMVFGYVAHGLGYRVMWSALTLLLLSGFALSFRLRVGYLVKPLPAAS